MHSMRDILSVDNSIVYDPIRKPLLHFWPYFVGVFQRLWEICGFSSGSPETAVLAGILALPAGLTSAAAEMP